MRRRHDPRNGAGRVVDDLDILRPQEQSRGTVPARPSAGMGERPIVEPDLAAARP
jgi:hypothetical protein